MIEKLFSAFKNPTQFMKLKKVETLKPNYITISTNVIHLRSYFLFKKYNRAHYPVMRFAWICFYLLLTNVQFINVIHLTCVINRTKK